jgi:excisionase family DNA binding protein
VIKRYFTPRQLAELLQTSADRVVDMIHAGAIVAVNIGAPGCRRATWRISDEAIEQFLAARSLRPVAAKQPRRRRKTAHVSNYY